MMKKKNQQEICLKLLLPIIYMWLYLGMVGWLVLKCEQKYLFKNKNHKKTAI
jgi:hypothetical protein